MSFLSWYQLGPAAHPVRAAAGLDPLAGGVAAAHHVPDAGHQLAVRPRVSQAPQLHTTRLVSGLPGKTAHTTQCCHSMAHVLMTPFTQTI